MSKKPRRLRSKKPRPWSFKVVLGTAVGSLLGVFSALAAPNFVVPPLTAPVVDEAGLVSPSTEAQLNSALQRLRRETGTQMSILTVKSLGGLEIEEASIQVTDQWKLGSKEADLGVLLLVAPEERAVRIEVGQGLEGALTDAHSKRIIDQAILPQFRSGNFEGGIVSGVFEIAKRTNPDFDLAGASGVDNRQYARSGGKRRGSILGTVIFVLVFLLFGWLNSLGGGRRGFGRRRGGGFGGGGFGGFGGGGFGGGSWGGGGGGFSGGGASGRW